MNGSTEILTATFNSSALESGSYNVITREMTLVVKSKLRKDGTASPAKSYTYTNVPFEMWETLAEADYNRESAGHIWIYEVKPRYPLAAR